MKKILEVKNPIKENQKMRNRTRILNFVMTFLICMSMPLVCFAAGEDFFDGFVVELCKWVRRAGMLVMLFGGIKLAMGWHSNTEEEKIQGLKTLVAGGMVIAIASAPDMFGL